MSQLEETVVKILRKEKINFEREKTFEDLKHGKYRFDFYFEYNGRKIAIEVQGRQHYERIDFFQKTRKSFLQAQERDRRKISYCLANNIEIYCIPFWAIPNIDSIKKLLSSDWRAMDRYFNDNLWRLYQKYIKH